METQACFSTRDLAVKLLSFLHSVPPSPLLLFCFHLLHSGIFDKFCYFLTFACMIRKNWSNHCSVLLKKRILLFFTYLQILKNSKFHQNYHCVLFSSRRLCADAEPELSSMMVLSHRRFQMVISFSFLSLNYFVSTKGKEKRVLYANKSLRQAGRL